MSEENVNDNGGQEQNSSPPPETNWINPDGTFGDLTKAPEGVGDFITKKGFKDFSSMTKSHQELETMMGNRENLIRIPETDDQQGWQELSRKLGCPEKPEDYTYEAKDGDPMDENLLSLFKQNAHRDGMPQKAFQDVVQFQIDAIKTSSKIYEDNLATELASKKATLRKGFESDDEYEAYTKKALGFADQFKLKDGTTSAADVIERKGLAYDPEILEMFGSLADSVSEDTLKVSRASVTATKDDKLKSIQANPAFCDALHPDHDKLMEDYWAVFNMSKEG